MTVALRDAILRKCHESMATKEKFFTENAGRIVECCTAMAKAFDGGGRLFVMGNGGSSCDAAHVSVEFMHPIIEKRPALPAMALNTDTALLTAVGNDQDFSLAFVQQLRHARRGPATWRWASPPAASQLTSTALCKPPVK